MAEYVLTTERLGLRNWLARDHEPFAAMNQDPEVMRYFPSMLTQKESLTTIDMFSLHFEKHGYTYFAVDLLDTRTFIGFCGLKVQAWQSKFTPCVDMGWRLKKSAWGKGYATEAAKACLASANKQFKLKEVRAFAPDLNLPSQRVMQKIGMQYLGEFQHPKIANDSRFKTCVAYTKTW